MKKPPLERYIVKRVLERVRARGGFWIKIHGSPLMMLGLPDLIGCHLGRFVAFEVKRAPGYPPTKIQLFVMKKIRAAGGIATLIWSVEQAEAELDRIEAAQEAQPPAISRPPARS